ncbi:MAG: general secretion pathway protein GspK [Planctomycetes bacterium]|nr:general secretion pathway protein GspK [Planctomycetota bacterium]
MPVPHRSRAAVLILVLWAIAILALLAGGLSFVIGQDRMLGMYERDRVVAHWLARAGVERAVAGLMLDSLEVDTDTEEWGKDTTLDSAALGNGTFSVVRDDCDDTSLGQYGASDESAKLNVNTVTKDQLMKLPHMTAPVAASIVDWRDNNEQPEEEGVERGYYALLAHPYTIRNGPPRTVRELLLVREVTPELFYGEDTNVNGRLDDNENDGESNPPRDNGDGRLDRGWYAWLTVYSYEKNRDAKGNKRLNLKNADAGTLASQLQIEDWAAQSIVNRRSKQEFKHRVDLLDVPLDTSVNRGSRDNDVNARDDEHRDQPVTTGIFERIVDQLTLHDEERLSGRVNLNTAPREVLRALLPDEAVEAIVGQRQGGGYFTSIGELLRISGVTKETFGQVENAIAVRSSVFRIYSEGRAASGIRETIECVVDRGGQAPRMLYWLESSP